MDTLNQNQTLKIILKRKMKTAVIKIKGTHCNACKLLIEDVSKDINGVKSCQVDFKTGETTIEHDEHFDFNLFKQEIESLGEYKVEINNKNI